MSANDYIQKLRDKYPHFFKASKLKMSPESLELVIRKSFECGYKEGREDAQNEKSLMERLVG